MNHPGEWPRPARAALMVLSALCCAGVGMLWQVQPRIELRRVHQQQLPVMQAQFRAALQRSAALPLLRARAHQLAGRLDTAAADVPDGDAWQATLSAGAQRHALTLDALQPSADGAELAVVGDYAALLLFVAELSQSPYALLFDALDISRQPDAPTAALLMTARVRYPSPATTDQEPAAP